MSILEEKRPLEEQEEISNKRQKLELYNNNVHDNIKVNKPLDGPDAQTPEQPTLKTPSHIEADTPTNEPVSHLSPQPKNIQHDQLSPVPVPEQPQLDKPSEPVESMPSFQQPSEPVEEPQPQPSEPVQPSSEVVESVETTQPSQLSESVEPVQPEQLSAPAQPSEPTEPAQAVQPSEPTQPVPEPVQPEQAQLSEVTDSVQPVQPTQFVQPSEYTPSAPSAAVQTQQPSEPVQPAIPAESVQSGEPIEPQQPSEQIQPAQPIEPQQPSEQIQSAQPIEPQQPSEQIQLAQPIEPQPSEQMQTAQQFDQSLQQPEQMQVQSDQQPQPQPAEVKPELPQLVEDGQSEAHQPQPESQPFDAPGVSYSSQDVPQDDFKEEIHDQSQPVVPPTPAGIEPIVLPNGTKLPPRSAAFGIPGGPPFSFNQLKFVSSLVKQLKKMKAAVPFLSPVDYISMGIPHYPEVISEPSDLGTVDRKVQKTIKAEEGGYYNFNDWETDIRRIFRNTEWFNGLEHPVSKMGKQVEESLDKQLKKMPPSTNDAVPSTSRGRGAPRRSQETGRPRREVHHPTMSQNDPNRSKRRKTTAYGRNGTADQMRHCAYILKELHKKVHSSYASPFYDPVDYLALGLPDYPQVVQQPMDLSTVGQKLNLGDYEGPSDFFGDMKLMFGNCYKYNPPGTPVHEAGRQTEAVFDEKWTQLPPLSTPLEISDDENSDAVKALQRQIEDMQKSLTDIKKKGTGAPERAPSGGGGGGGSRGGKRGSTGGQVGRPRRKSYDEDDENYQIPEITFDMKKELAGKIQQLEGDQLDKAIKIIYETLDLDNNSDEIELDIDVLPVKTLQKLYMFVVKPQKQKRGPYNKQHVDVDLQPRPPKRAGTGGVKRKSMNEDEEALKIQALEAKLKSFEGVTDIQINQPTTIPENDEASSGSDSDSVVSEDSGSESD